MPWRVFYEHQLLAEHPDDSAVAWANQGRDLIVTPPGGQPVTYLDGQFSGAGLNAECGFHAPDPSCKRCNKPPPPPEVGAGGV